MKCSVTVSLVPEARGGPFVYWDDLKAAARSAAQLGFQAIEIFPSGPGAIDAKELSSILVDNNLKLAAMGTGAGWVRHKLSLTSPDANTRTAAEAFIRSIIDTAGPFGAPAIIGSMQGRWGDSASKETATGWLGEVLKRLGEHARRYQVPVLYEPLNRYETNLFTTVGEARKFLCAVGQTNLKLLADLFHMNIEEVDLAAALREAGEWLGHVHFVDSNRRAAGLGHIDYAPIAATLKAINYQGYLSAEAFAYPDSETAARQTMESFRKFFD